MVAPNFIWDFHTFFILIIFASPFSSITKEVLADRSTERRLIIAPCVIDVLCNTNAIEIIRSIKLVHVALQILDIVIILIVVVESNNATQSVIKRQVNSVLGLLENLVAVQEIRNIILSRSNTRSVVRERVVVKACKTLFTTLIIAEIFSSVKKNPEAPKRLGETLFFILCARIF